MGSLNCIEITSKDGLHKFRCHITAIALGDFILNEKTNEMEMVGHPSDIVDIDPERALALAKRLGYTQDDGGVWCDPLIKMIEG